MSGQLAKIRGHGRWNDLTDRNAFLIGVPTCDDDLFEALPHVVSADIARMTKALGQSGYDVRHCGIGPRCVQEPTGNRIRAGMMQALRDAPPGGILIVYFSGHGVTIDGKSYLVPQDVYLGADGPAPESLVPLVPRQLGECRARLVLFVVDACRNDLADGASELPHSDTLPYPVDGAFVLLNSCRPGERSTYGADGSYFTEVLAEVLDRRHPARTLGDAYDALVRGLARKATRIESVGQTPDLVLSQHGNLLTPPRQIVICDGDQVGEAWRRAIEETPLWQRTSIDTIEIERIRSNILEIVDECAQHWLNAETVLLSRTQITDPWAAQDCPVRVLAAVDACLPRDADLTAMELASVITAPFLREAALSAGIRIAATVAPVDFTRTYHDGSKKRPGNYTRNVRTRLPSGRGSTSAWTNRTT